MKVLFVSSESAPFVKTGGLGDVTGSLPSSLNEKGVDCRVIIPLYHCIPQQYRDQMKYVNHIYIDMGWRKQYCGIFELKYNNCIYYFIDNEYYFNGDKPYDYIHLDCEKFIFFSKAALSILPTLDFHPEVIHCNDWQTGAIPVFLDTFRDNPFFNGIKTVMTIHNLKYQGRWGLQGIKDIMGISNYYFTNDKIEYYKDANLLKGGLVYADKITTVSETYANEIKTSEYGEGLDGLLSARASELMGIVNGISYDEWNPATDVNVPEKYNSGDFQTKKKINKTYLQSQLNMPIDENKFMIGIVSRLTDQKGFDIVMEAMERLCAQDVQVVVLGTGDEGYENLFRHYAWKYPDRVSANIYFSGERSHLIYAACDAFLMPSRFEPCGLSQLISLRYGTLPIVRETGGLKDTVVPYNEFTEEGTGFSFKNYNSNDMMHVVEYAKDIFYNRKTQWNQIVKNAMDSDFSWNVSAQKYIDMYREITGIYEVIKINDKPQEIKEDVVKAEKITKTKETVPTEKKTVKSSTKKVKETKVSEQPIKKPTTKSSEKSSKKSMAKATEKPSKKPIEKVKSVEEITKKPEEKSIEKKIEKVKSAEPVKAQSAKKQSEKAKPTKKESKTKG